MRAAIVVATALTALAFAPYAAAGTCVRPTDPGGANDYDYGSDTVLTFGNDRVLVWYTTTGEHAVNPASTRSDGVPDDVADVAQVTSDALASYAAMGFRAPVSDATNPSCGSYGGDARLDVYLVDMVGADGMTGIDDGRCTMTGSARACASFVFAKSNFSDYYATSDIGIHTVLPHETFHVVQNAYDANLDRFWAEGTAQWAAKTLDPSLMDLERFLPAFFSEAQRSLDSAANGVTSSFLYGAAIWPVYLTQRHGNDVVRAILDQEAIAGGAALTATDVVLKTESSSMAIDFPLFSAWNVATGKRAGQGGYTNAATYPLVTVAEMTGGSAKGITSGEGAFFFDTKVDAPMMVTIATDLTRNAAMLVPLANGIAQVDAATPLPAIVMSEGIVVVSGITSSKTDAPFTLSLAVPTALADGGVGDASEDSDAGAADAPSVSSKGSCAVSPENRGGDGAPIVVAFLAFVGTLRSRVKFGG